MELDIVPTICICGFDKLVKCDKKVITYQKKITRAHIVAQWFKQLSDAGNSYEHQFNPQWLHFQCSSLLACIPGPQPPMLESRWCFTPRASASPRLSHWAMGDETDQRCVCVCVIHCNSTSQINHLLEQIHLNSGLTS